MSAPYPAITRLRVAAPLREWGELQAALTDVLMELEYFAGLRIAAERAYAQLAAFEAHNAGATWARQLLVSLVSFGMAPAELPAEAGAQHNGAGASNYVLSLLELARSAERKTPLENRIRFLANALANLMLADLAAAWYGANPQAWAEQHTRGAEIDPDSGLTIRQVIYTRFWLDDATATRDTAAWLALTDQIERTLD